MEMWRYLMALPPVSPSPVESARHAEETGWDGGSYGDSQHMLPDCYVLMGQALTATTTLRLGLGVTNADTRDAAVTACAIATAHYYSGGRAVLGIGRGDSALHRIGRHPIKLRGFEEYLTKVQAYLRGEAPVLDTEGEPAPFRWSAGIGFPKPPMDVAGTGPKVIGLGARIAEQVSFSVGADPARIKWAVDQARAARDEAGLDRDGLSLGAYVLISVDEDLAKARDRVRGLAAVHTRFSSMNTDTPLEELEGGQRAAASDVSAKFKSSLHAQNTSPAAQAISDEYLDSYAVIGPPARCVERLLELVELGIERFYVLPSGGMDSTATLFEEQYDLIAEKVMPAVRQHAG